MEKDINRTWNIVKNIKNSRIMAFNERNKFLFKFHSFDSVYKNKNLHEHS